MVTSGTRRRWARTSRALIAVGVAVGLAVLTTLPVAAEPRPGPSADGRPAKGYEVEPYVKYYVVTESYQGEPENVREIADRFLGSGSRDREIMDLNEGRSQPDDDKLTDPDKLTPGWALILPWDAVGPGVRMGTLPTTMPPKAKAPGSGSAGKGNGAEKGNGAAGRPTPTPCADCASGSPGPSRPASPSVPPRDGDSCTVTGGSSGKPSNWAARRLAIPDSWSRTKGAGVMVAVVDSGVDASLPQLSERVSDGADVVTGSGSGGIDCVGTGTAMASLIAAERSDVSSFTGVAPESTIAPIRLATTSTKPARPADQATAIDVAVSTGATVIALGGYVDSSKPEVARAIANAVNHDVVVLVGAAEDSTKGPELGPTPGVLRVAGIGPDGELATKYRPGGVDIVAPGVDVAHLGVAGTGMLSSTGTQYAVALAAGQAALVRAAHPGLSAESVTRRIKATADRVPDGKSKSKSKRDSRYGSGMIDPVASVTRDIPGERTTAPGAPADRSGGGSTWLLVVVGLVVLGAIALVTLRVRRMVRAEREAEDDEPDEPEPDTPPAVAGSTTTPISHG